MLWLITSFGRLPKAARKAGIAKLASCPTSCIYLLLTIWPYGIDCLENGQAFGQKATQATSALVFGKVVTLQPHGYDKYQRTMAVVLLPDGTNVNHTLVQESWCWWHRKYPPGDMVLE